MGFYVYRKVVTNITESGVEMIKTQANKDGYVSIELLISCFYKQEDLAEFLCFIF